MPGPAINRITPATCTLLRNFNSRVASSHFEPYTFVCINATYPKQKKVPMEDGLLAKIGETKLKNTTQQTEQNRTRLKHPSAWRFRARVLESFFLSLGIPAKQLPSEDTKVLNLGICRCSQSKALRVNPIRSK
jgi:hypothetical protein